MWNGTLMKELAPEGPEALHATVDRLIRRTARLRGRTQELHRSTKRLEESTARLHDRLQSSFPPPPDDGSSAL